MRNLTFGLVMTLVICRSTCCQAAGSSAAGQLSRCTACCRLRRPGARPPTTRSNRLTDSYVCVPLGVGTGSTTDGGARYIDPVNCTNANELRLSTGTAGRIPLIFLISLLMLLALSVIRGRPLPSRDGRARITV